MFKYFILSFIILDIIMIYNYRKSLNIKNEKKINQETIISNKNIPTKIKDNKIDKKETDIINIDDIYKDIKFKELILKNQETYENYNEIKDSLLKMKYDEFEEWIAMLFRKMGYVAYVSYKNKYGNDGGKDVIAQKDGDKIYIECKRWNKNTGHSIAAGICKTLIGTMIGDGVCNGIIATTGDISCKTDNYIRDLNKNNPTIKLEIWDLNKIINEYMKASNLIK